MIYIGIDPDLKKSGFAVWDSEEKRFVELRIHTFWDVISKIESYKQRCARDLERLEVYVEAGFKIAKSNWRPFKGTKVGEKISKNVGENQAIGKLFREYLMLHNIDHVLVTPTGLGKDAEAFAKMTGIVGAGEEKRDAAMLVFGRV